MADIHVTCGTSLSTREGISHFVVEVVDQLAFFSLSLSREDRILLAGLNQLPHKRLIPRPLRGKVLTVSWTLTNGKSFSLNEIHEDIPPIEEFLCVGTWRELLGAVLSKRDR